MRTNPKFFRPAEVDLLIGDPALAEKLASLAKCTREAGADAFLSGALDEVCWLFNLRGSDVPCCPVVAPR